MRNIILSALFLTLFFSACKKNKNLTNIIESNIGFGTEQTDIRELKSNDIFKPSSNYRAYFSAAGMKVGSELVFIGTQSINDDDFAPADLQIKKTDFELKDIGVQKLFRRNDAKLNSVTPSLIKIGDLHQFYYLRQETHGDAHIYVMESDDEGSTWKNERKVSFQNGFNCIINDRVLLLASGRIIIPVAFTPNINDNYNKQYIFCYYSDDKGRTWKKSSDLKAGTPLMEPSVAEISRGKLIMVIRSQLGKLLFSRSADNGINWSVIEKSHLNSPSSTSAIYKIDNEHLCLIWNNTVPYSHVHDRKPLSMSLSKDGGQTWSLPYNIGNVDREINTSPGMFKNGDDFIIYYNYSVNAADYGIRAKKIEIKLR